MVERALRAAGWAPGRCRRRERPPDRGDRAAGLGDRLGELAAGGRLGDDAAPGPEPDALAGHLEGADGNAQLEPGHRARVADRAGVGLTARGLERRDHLHRLDLGRSGHRARGEGGAQQLRVAGLRAQAARDGRDHVPDPGVRLDARPAGGDRAVLADPSEVVAHEVDDHHVLGRVLGRGAQGAGRVRGALDRVALDGAAPPPQEALGREADERAPRAADQRAEPGRGGVEGVGEHVRGVARPGGLEAQRDVGLEQLPRGDALHAVGDGGPVARRARDGVERPDQRRIDGRRRPGQPPRPDGPVPVEGGLALRRPERLEPPALAVEADDVVEQGEPRGGQRRRGGRWRRKPLHARAQPVAEEPEPAAADDRAGRLGMRQGLEQRERILAVVRLANGVRAQQRTAPGPLAHEPERPVLAGQPAHRLGRGLGALEGHADSAGGHALQPTPDAWPS